MARRINTQFLTKLGLAALAVAGVILFAATFLVKKSADPYIAAGDKAAAAHNWADAEKNYAQALAIAHDNEAVWIRRGDVLSRLVETDPERIGQDRYAWQQALEINTRSVPALQRLLASYDEEARIRETATVLEKERDYAQKLHAVSPDDLYAETSSYLVTIKAWLVGVQTDSATIEDALTNLQRISKADPTQSNPPFFIARARVEQGSQAAAANDPIKAGAFYAAAEKTMTDAVKSVEDKMAGADEASLPKMRNGAAEVYWRAAQVEAALSVSIGLDPTIKTQDIHRAQDYINNALKLVNADDPAVVDMNVEAKDIYLAMGDKDAAEKVLRDLNKQRPDDQIVRLALAQFLSGDPNKLQEAIDILQAPQAPNEGQKNQLIQFAKELKLRTTAQLATLQLTELDSITDDARKQQLLKQASDEYDTLYRAWGENLDTLKLRGQLALARGQGTEAVQALSRAVTTIPEASKNDELQEFLGRAYEMTHQDTQAENCYNLVVTHHPDFYPALLRLTRLRIMHQELETVDSLLQTLERRYPQDVAVMVLRLAYLDTHRQENKDAIDRYFARIPEDTDAQRLQKVNMAAGLGKLDDMVRLLTAVVANEPKRVDVIQTLARFYVQSGNLDAAKKVIADGLKANPDSPDLQIDSARLNGASDEELLKLQRNIYGQIADPFTRALTLARVNAAAGDMFNAELELKEALRIKPDDGSVWDSLFTVYLTQHKLDDASACITHLAKANQDHAGGHLYQFQVAMARKDYDSAVKIATQLVQDLPELSGAWLSLGQAEEALGKPEVAIGDYSAARDRQSDNPVALAGLIECNYTLGNNSQALEFIKDAVKSYPDDTKWLDMEIRHYLRFGPLSEAEPLLSKEVTTTRTPSPATVSQLIDVELKLANAYFRINNTDTAKICFDKANNLINQAQRIWPDEPAFYTLAGEACLMAGADGYPKGVDAIRQLALRDKWKDSPTPYTILADYQLSAGKLADAESSLRTALNAKDAQAKDIKDIDQQLARVLAADNKVDDALSLLGTSSDPSIRNQRINIKISNNRIDDAEKEIQAALDAKPAPGNTDAADLLSEWASIEISRNHYDLAAKHVADALDKVPTHAMALYYRGSIEMHATPPDVDKAIADLMAARQQLGTNPRIHGLLADAYHIQGDFDKEKNELTIGVQQAPGDKLIRLQLIQADINSRPPRLGEAVAQAEDIRRNPQFAGDADFLTIESHVFMATGNYTRALQANALALQSAPNNASLIRDQMQLLLLNSDYSGLNTAADSLLGAVAEKDKTWWMFDYRAIARAHLNNADGARDDLKQDLTRAHDDPDLAVMQVAVQNLCTHVGAGDVQAFVTTMPQDDIRWKLALAIADMAGADTKTQGADAARQVAASADLEKLKDDQKVFALRVVESAYLAAKPPMQQDAVEIDRRILKILPEDVSTLNNLANRLVAIDPKGNLKDALAYSTQAVDILHKAGKSDPHVIDTLGWIQLLSGNYLQAANTLQPVFSNSPDLSIGVHLATAYAKQSQPLLAKNVIVKAKGIISDAAKANQPVDPDLKAQLEDLEKTVDSLSAAKVDAGSP